MKLIAVVDTNVVVAAMLTARDEAPTVRLLRGMLDAAFPYALSTALLAEYRSVLNRAHLRARHGLTVDDIEALLVALARSAIVLEPKHGAVAPDPGDQHLWNLLAAHAGLCLVTGDKLLLQHEPAPAPMFTPVEFIARLSAHGVHEAHEPSG